MYKSVTVLGSTGSIGTQALDVCEKQNIKVDAAAFGSNIKLGEAQIRKYGIKYCAVSDENAYKALKQAVCDTGVRLYSGSDGVCEMIEDVHSPVCLNAVSGFSGLMPTLSAIKACKRLALANKESLVCAGENVMALVKEKGTELIPVDSEHCAIFQCLKASGNKDEIKKLLLTCSGGKFFGYTKEQLERVTPQEALKHPVWNMGKRITVDCATLMNKGFEVIEAKHLFGVNLENIEVLIHRQGTVHSMAAFRDGAVMAQLAVPDMRLPVQYALTYPCRESSDVETLDLIKISALTFSEPDTATFPLLSLAYEAERAGGIIPCVMNAADEIAVKLFTEGKISFNDIERLVTHITRNTENVKSPTVEMIKKADARARNEAEAYAEKNLYMKKG